MIGMHITRRRNSVRGFPTRNSGSCQPQTARTRSSRDTAAVAVNSLARSGCVVRVRAHPRIMNRPLAVFLFSVCGLLVSRASEPPAKVEGFTFVKTVGDISEYTLD